MTGPAAQAGIQVRAGARVERGTAEACACGGRLERDGAVWRCAGCSREYT